MNPAVAGGLADLVMTLHFGFLVLLALGSIVAWRWERLLWLHLPCVGWAFCSLVARAECPLTDLEKDLRRRAGESVYRGGFIDRYVDGVLYPVALSPVVAMMVGLLVVIGYVGIGRRRRTEGSLGPGVAR